MSNSKALLSALLWFSLAGAANATIARVQGVSGFTSSGVTATATLSALTAGNTVIGCVVHGSGNALNTVSDGTNSYTILTGSAFAGYQEDLFYKENVSGGPTVITATLASGSQINIVADEFSGVSTSAATDGSAFGTVNFVSGTNSFTSGNLSPTPTHNGDLIYGCASTLSGANLSAGTSAAFTLAVNDTTHHAFSEYIIQTTAASIAATFTPTTTDYGWIDGVALQAAGAAPGKKFASFMIHSIGVAPATSDALPMGVP